jgi:hypothetical protein
MALYSAFVQSGSENYSTQINAGSAQEAFNAFCDVVYNSTASALTSPDAPTSLSASDIIYVTKMNGLTNMWLCQAGRDGKYVSVVMARTVTQPAA